MFYERRRNMRATMAPYHGKDSEARSALRSSSVEGCQPQAPPPRPIPQQPMVPPLATSIASAPTSDSAPQPTAPQLTTTSSAASSFQADLAPATVARAASAHFQPQPPLQPRAPVPLAPFPFMTRVPATYHSSAPLQLSSALSESVTIGGAAGYYHMMHNLSHQPPTQLSGKKRKAPGGGASWRHACQTCGHLVKVMKESHKKGSGCTFQIADGVVVPPPTDTNRGKCRYPGCTYCEQRIREMS
jgi:hypothetical protein